MEYAALVFSAWKLRLIMAAAEVLCALAARVAHCSRRCCRNLEAAMRICLKSLNEAFKWVRASRRSEHGGGG